ncbi:MAG: GMC family oxidoreductase [Candidatus Dadabacteria bacterium]|nr:MAG: GMC family oxidoreductase [Candidatus Dadabacteria bacterium]
MWPDNLVQATQLDTSIDDRATVVIIGTGAGGPAAAWELARQGVDVVMLEEGGFYPPEFYRDLGPLEAFRHLYRDFGMTTAIGKNPLRDPAVPFPLGKCVGGTTAVNSGTCFRTPESILELWRREFGLPFTDEEMEPWFDLVEDVLAVEPVPDDVLGRNGELFAAGAAALGWHGAPLRRNARGCRGSGRCVFGCPTNAKRGTQLSYVPRALMSGARLYSDVRAERIVRDGDRIVAVEGVILDRETNQPKAPFRIACDQLIVAAGAVGTPALLMRNGIQAGHPQMGRNLRLHPGIRVCADFDEPVRGWKGVPQGYYVDEFWKQRGIMFEGIFVPPGVALPILPGVGDAMRQHFERYPNLAAFGAMVKDTSNGTVRPRGRTATDIRYSLNDHDKTNLVDAVKKAAEAWFAAGAKRVYPAIYGHAVLNSPDDIRKIDPRRVRTQHLEPMAFHPMGTVRMAADDKLGVLDADGRVRGLTNLRVADASIFPTCLGVNPMESIMAFAHRIANDLATELLDG